MTPYPFYNPNMPVGMDNQQPYGVGNTLPQSLTPATSPFPSLFQDRQSLFGIRPTYAKGGHVGPLSSIVENLRNMGQRNDSVLAHISPEEAMELEQRHGGDINPHTGLPQYGLMDWLGPTLASVVGFMIGGPKGAMIAGSLSGAAIEGTKHERPLEGALMGGLKGAGIGALTAVGGPFLGKAFGIGSLAGAGGLKGAAAVAGSAAAKRAAAFESLKALGQAPAAGGLKGAVSGLGSTVAKGWGEMSLLDKGLLGTSILGSLAGGRSQPQVLKTYEDNNKVLEQPNWRPDQMPAPIAPMARAVNPGNPDIYHAGMIPEHEYFGRPNYAHGGSIGSEYYHGTSGGQDDDIDTNVRPGDFIWDSDFVSQLGDGNPDAGASELLHEAKKIGGNNISSPLSKYINAKVSPKEVKWSSEVVTKLGKGSNATGVKILDRARERMRTHKRSAPSDKIPPKSKSLSYYMFGGKS